MLSMLAFMLSAIGLLSGCQPATGRITERADTLRIGDVTFVAQTLMIGDDPSTIPAADLDNDGHLDLVAANAQGLNIFRGDGQGGLVTLGHVPAGENPVDLAFAEVDGNGTVDVVVANHETDYLTILLGDGKGRFRAAPNSPLRIDVRPHPHAVTARDLDNDGYVDLVVDHRAGEGLLILRGIGGGSFESPGTLLQVGGDPYRGMAIGDLDRDGQLDLVTPNPNEVGVLLGKGAGRIGFVRAPSVPAADPFAVELGDLNGDGRLDLVAAGGEESSFVHLFWGNGRGGFQQAKGSPFQFGAGARRSPWGTSMGMAYRMPPLPISSQPRYSC